MSEDIVGVELLPCPFCQRQPKRNGRFGTVGGVVCVDGTHRVQMYGRIQDDADAAWNTRPTPSSEGAREVIDDRGRWFPKPGTEVRVSERYMHHGDWAHERLWVVGYSMERGKEGLNVTVAHEWPPEHGFTDDFWINRPFKFDDLEPVHGFASDAGPSAREAALVEALRKCRAQFDFYVEQHMKKSPPDMDKAATNQEFVELCEEALTSAGAVG